jgi:hypothetical protein
MDISEIRDGVASAIKQWMVLQERINASVSFSVQAEELVVTLIENIDVDPSPFWRSDIGNDGSRDNLQRYAITLIPNALNDVFNVQRRYRFRRYSDRPLRISSWELYRTMSATMQNWCFIPEEI